MLGLNTDGTATILQHLNTSATILGTERATLRVNGTFTTVDAIVTTAGLMREQSDGSFTAASGLTLPSDVVPAVSAAAIPVASDGDLVIERYTPDSSDPSHGTVRLADFPLQSDGTYGPEIDTVVATHVAGNPLGGPLYVSRFAQSGPDDLVLLNHVWYGHTDGTFTQGQQVSASPPPAGASYYSIYPQANNAIGLVAFPAAPGAGSSETAQAFLNQPDNSFLAGSPVDFGTAGTTDGPLLVGDFTNDGTADLVTGIRSGSQPTGFAIAPGVGDGSFLPPTVISMPGFEPLLWYYVDGDQQPDLLGLLVTSNSLVTLLNTTPAGPIIELSPSANPTSAGEPVSFFALVTTTGFGGDVIFMDGSAMLGSATLQSDNRATLVTDQLVAGSHSITAVVGYPGSSSSSITQIVNADPVKAPLLTLNDVRVKLPSAVVAGDRGVLRMTLNNRGGQTFSGPLSVHVSITNVVSTSGISQNLMLPVLENRIVALGPNRHVELTTPLTIPDDLPEGTYLVSADIDGGPTVPAASISSARAASSSFPVVQRFGTVGSRANVKLVRHLPNGNVVTFKMTGPGLGVVTSGGGPVTLGNGGPDFQVTIENPSLNSKVTITQTGSTAPNIVSLTVQSAYSGLGLLDVRQDTPHTITVRSPISKLMLGTTPPAQARPNAFPAPDVSAGVTLNSTVDQISAASIDNGSLSLTDVQAMPSIKVGTLASGFGIKSAATLSSLAVDSAAAGSIVSAAAIGKLLSRGDFDASLTLNGGAIHGDALGTGTIDGSIDAGDGRSILWAINGNIGKIHVAGNVSGLQLLGGAQLGPQSQLASPPAAYTGTQISSLDVIGSVSSSILAAGLDPVDGVLLNGDDTLLSAGAIRSVRIDGELSADSRVLAATLPDSVTLGSQKIATVNDPRFKL